MNVIAPPAKQPARAPHPRSRYRSPPDRWLAAALIEGAAFALLVGSSGSVPGRIGRLLVVVVVVAGGSWLALGSQARRDTWALILGLAGTVTGLGVGLHALRPVPVVLVLFGLGLLIGGGIGLARRLPGWWRLAALPAAAVLLAFVLYPLTIAVYATNVPRLSEGTASPARYGLAYRDVRLPTSDGATLSGWYLPSRNAAAVVLTHGSGAGSTKASVLPQAEILARSGFGVLLIDARGHGASSGDAMDFGWFGERDITAGVDYLSARPEVDSSKIGVVGESMGGEEAIGAAGVDHRIAAVVSEGTTGRTAADHDWMPGGFAGLLQRGIDSIAYSAAGLLTNAEEPMSLRSAVRAAAPHPVLLIAAGKSTSEVDAAAYLRQVAPSRVQIWVVAQAGHTQGISVARDEWRATVVGFLSRALGPAASRSS